MFCHISHISIDGPLPDRMCQRSFPRLHTYQFYGHTLMDYNGPYTLSNWVATY